MMSERASSHLAWNTPHLHFWIATITVMSHMCWSGSANKWISSIGISGLVKRPFGMLFFKHQNTSLWYARRQSDGALFPATALITTDLVINGLRS